MVGSVTIKKETLGMEVFDYFLRSTNSAVNITQFYAHILHIHKEIQYIRCVIPLDKEYKCFLCISTFLPRRIVHSCTEEIVAAI